MIDLRKIDNEVKIDNVKNKENVKIKQKKETKNNESDLKVYSFTLYKSLVEKLDNKLNEYNKDKINKLNRSKVINMLLNDYLDELFDKLQ